MRLSIGILLAAGMACSALAELVDEGAFNETKALELARNYLHDNAARLYGDLKR